MTHFVYPADAEGHILKGFCPTVCDEKDSLKIANRLIANLNRHNINYDCVVIADGRQEDYETIGQ